IASRRDRHARPGVEAMEGRQLLSLALIEGPSPGTGSAIEALSTMPIAGLSHLNTLDPTNDPPGSLDGGGYVENFPGNIQIVKQTWNYERRAYDLVTDNAPVSLKSQLDTAWGQRGGLADQIRAQFIQETTDSVKRRGVGFGGDGTVHVTLSDGAANELRVRQDGPLLKLKYLASGSEDFYESL